PTNTTHHDALPIYIDLLSTCSRLYRIYSSLTSSKVFLIHFFMSPLKNCKINGIILSWSFNIKNKKNGIKIIVRDTCTADVKIDFIQEPIFLVISLMDSVILSCDS